MKFLLILFIYDLPHSIKDFETLKGDYLGQKGQKKQEGRRKKEGEGEEEKEREAIFTVATWPHCTSPFHTTLQKFGLLFKL